MNFLVYMVFLYTAGLDSGHTPVFAFSTVALATVQNELLKSRTIFALAKKIQQWSGKKT